MHSLQQFEIILERYTEKNNLLISEWIVLDEFPFPTSDIIDVSKLL